MASSRQLWLWSGAIISFIAGLLLLLNETSAGYMLIVIGISFLGASTRAGQSWATANPILVRWGLIIMTLLLISLLVIAGAALLFR